MLVDTLFKAFHCLLSLVCCYMLRTAALGRRKVALHALQAESSQSLLLSVAGGKLPEALLQLEVVMLG